MAEQQRDLENDTLRRARVAMYAGVGSFLFGLIVLYLGYSGAANNPIVEAQIPYLISGGLFGAALMILGGIGFAASIILRVLGSEPTAAAMSPKTLVSASFEAPATPAATNGKSTSLVFVAGGGSSFHVQGCRLVERAAEVHEVAKQVAIADGMTPCRVCSPEQA